MQSSKKLACLLFWVLAQKVFAFGSLGHYVIGEAVSCLVANSTLKWVQTNGFFAEFNNSWALAAIQADILKRRPVFKWTSRFHYLNVDDDPPTYCPGVRGWNATKGGNVLKGIERFTNLLASEKGSSFSALMLIHLLQDLSNALHLSGKARGGNDVKVEYNGHRVVLHRLWDSVLVQDLADQMGGTDALISNITESAKSRFCIARASWTQDSWMDELVAKADAIQMLNCKVVWRDELRTPAILLPIMNGLLVDAAAYSACHWDRLAAGFAPDALVEQGN